MSEKGSSKKEMLERFEKMGIPVPLKPIQNPQVQAKNPEMASKMEQIRNGALKNNYQNFIEKAEKVSHAPSNLPIPKPSTPKSQKTTNTPQLESFTPKNSQAKMYEDMLFGESSTPSNSYTENNSEISDFGPSSVDTRARLQQRLNQKQNELQNENFSKNSIGLNLTEVELNERISEIAKEISKEMIKKVLLEFSKKEGGLIVESQTVKRAEVVGKNKVKIGNKTYLIKPISE
jgi:hypothetical protein